jgi:hypothetical protein
MGANVKDAILVAASHKNPPTVTVSGTPLFTDLVKAESVCTGMAAGTELITTLTVPLVAMTEAMTTGRASIAKGGALTAEPLL